MIDIQGKRFEDLTVEEFIYHMVYIPDKKEIRSEMSFESLKLEHFLSTVVTKRDHFPEKTTMKEFFEDIIYCANITDDNEQILRTGNDKEGEN